VAVGTITFIVSGNLHFVDIGLPELKARKILIPCPEKTWMHQKGRWA
jgi:hypothetical protein